MPFRIKTFFSYLAETEIWIVAAAVAISLLKPALLPFAILIALPYWGIRWIAFGVPGRRTPVDIGIILMLILIPVTIWATALPQKTLPQVYRLLLGILFFYAILNWTAQTKKLSWIITGLVIVGFGLAGFAILSVQWATDKLQFIPASIYNRFEILVADTVHPNVMAGSLAFILPVALSLLLFLFNRFKLWQTFLLLAATLFTAAVLLLTQSRGALIGTGMVLILLIVLRWRWGFIILPLAALAGLILIYQVGLDAILDFITAGVVISGADGRVEIWSRAIYMIQDFSFTGVGFGSFGDVADLLYPFFLAAPGRIPHAHNLFLQIAVDLGIPGLIAWLSIFLGLTITAWQLYRHGKRHDDPWAAALGAAFLGSQLALAVHGLADSVTWGMVKPAPLVWGLWGAAVASWLVIVHPKRVQSSQISQESAIPGKP